DRRRELEQLETRIGNARLRLLEQHADVLRPTTVTAAPFSNEMLPAIPAAGLEHQEAVIQRRAETLIRVADELADQRLHLAEQVERLLRTQQQWHADRMAALHDLEVIGNRFEARELELDRQGRELQAQRAAVQAEHQAAGQYRLRLEAEQVRAAAREADRRAVLDARKA